MKTKTFRQQDLEQMKGKRGFRLREIQEQEELEIIRKFLHSNRDMKEDNEDQTP